MQQTTSSSLRLRWEYTGGSELFVVYSDGRDTRGPGFPALVNRTLADQGDAAVPVLTPSAATRPDAGVRARRESARPARSRRRGRWPAR